jgi:hypothetical protein
MLSDTLSRIVRSSVPERTVFVTALSLIIETLNCEL